MEFHSYMCSSMAKIHAKLDVQMQVDFPLWKMTIDIVQQSSYKFIV